MPKRDTVELRWVYSVIRRWLWLILGCVLLAGVSAYIVTSRMTPIYEATVTLLVKPSQNSNTSESGLLSAAEQLAVTYSQMLTSRPVLESVLTELETEVTVNELTERITVEPVTDTQLIRMTVADPDPVEAAFYANAISEAFTTHIDSLNNVRYSRSLADLKEKLETQQSLLEVAQQEREKLTASMIQEVLDKTRLEGELSEYQDDYQVLQEDYRSLQQAVNQATDMVKIVSEAHIPAIVTSAPYTATVTLIIDDASFLQTYSRLLTGQPVLDASIAQLGLSETADELADSVKVEPIPDTQLIQLNVEYSNSTQALLIADTIAQVFISQVEALLKDPYDEDLDTVQKQMDVLSSLIEKTQSEIEIVTAGSIQDEMQLSELEGRIGTYGSEISALRRDYEQLRLTADDAAEAVVIAEYAEVPTNPIERRILYLSVAVAIGLIIALGLAFLFEHLDDKIRTAENVKQYLGTDLAGSVGRLPKKGSKLITAAQPRSPESEGIPDSCSRCSP